MLVDAAKCSPMPGAYGLWRGSDFIIAISAVAQYLGFSPKGLPNLVADRIK